VKLSDGRTLRIATAKIVLSQPQDATQSIDLFPDGLTPDVAVKIDPKTERDVVLTVQTNENLTASLQPRVNKKGLTEAQLVKVFHGQSIDIEPPIRASATNTDVSATDKEHEEEGEIQNVRDVVLQRAVDILKGIRVLLTWQ
jgi:hypothetical protein